jgi:hypothetical protein
MWLRQDGVELQASKVNLKDDCVDSKYMRSGDGYIALVPKGGSTSISLGAKTVRRSELDPSLPITIYVRNPVDRFVSGWRYFSWDNDRFLNFPYRVSAEAWLHYITEFCPYNHHWYPVVGLHPKVDNVLPLSDLGGKRQNVGKSQATISDALREQVEAHYSEDIALWRSATGK